MSMIESLSAFQIAIAPMLGQSSNGADAAAGIVGMLFCCVFSLLSIAFFAFWIWMLIDCATRTFPGDNDKLIWILVIVLTGVIGAAIYYFVGRPKGTKA